MKYYSIRLKISILFAFVFILICVLFIFCITSELDSSYEEQNEYNEHIVKSFISNYTPRSDVNVTEHFLSRGFSIVKDKKMNENIRENGKYFFRIVSDFGIFSSLSYDYELFLRIERQDYDILLTSKRNNIAFEFILFGFFLSLFISLLLYLSIMKSLSPLERLRKQIAKTMSGEEFYMSDYKNDEIGEIANEFLSVMSKMHELIESRRLFLHTIIHEFKTPIGKGRLIAEMMKEKKQKERLITIFKRLDSLIDESAKIESLFSKNYNLQIKSHTFDNILHQSKKLLLNDDFDKKVKVKKNENVSFAVDISVFALMLKNLIDNAIKYSEDGLCIIECFEGCIIVKNKGKPLKLNYTEYLKPFARDKNNKVEGMGLGLYIVEKTCKSHNLELSYEYVNSFHCFKVSFPPPPTSHKEKSTF